jgi:hypothetical protein
MGQLGIQDQKLTAAAFSAGNADSSPVPLAQNVDLVLLSVGAAKQGLGIESSLVSLWGVDSVLGTTIMVGVVDTTVLRYLASCAIGRLDTDTVTSSIESRVQDPVGHRIVCKVTLVPGVEADS